MAELNLGGCGLEVETPEGIRVLDWAEWRLPDNNIVRYPALWTLDDWAIEDAPPCALVTGFGFEDEHIAPELPRVEIDQLRRIE